LPQLASVLTYERHYIPTGVRTHRYSQLSGLASGDT
jgi:hypothetical protein